MVNGRRGESEMNYTWGVMVKEGEGFSGANYLKQRRSGLIARREKGEVFVYLFGALVDVKLGIFYILFAI